MAEFSPIPWFYIAVPPFEERVPRTASCVLERQLAAVCVAVAGSLSFYTMTRGMIY